VIGVYTTTISAIVALTSSCILPVVAALTLSVKIWSTKSYYHKSEFAVSIVVVLCSSLISVLTAQRMLALRQRAEIELISNPFVSNPEEDVD
jgi:hypothetical protein